GGARGRGGGARGGAGGGEGGGGEGERALPVQDVDAADAEARVRLHAVEGEDLRRRARVAVADEQGGARTRRPQRRRRLDDLHSVGALERKADVGRHQHGERRPLGLGGHGLRRTHWMWPIITSWVNGVASSRRRTGPGSMRRKKPVTWRSSRTRRKPEPSIQSCNRRTVTDCSTSSCFSLPSSARAMNVFASLGSWSSQGAWRASQRKVAKAARRPTSRCRGTGRSRRGRWAPASDRV